MKRLSRRLSFVSLLCLRPLASEHIASSFRQHPHSFRCSNVWLLVSNCSEERITRHAHQVVSVPPLSYRPVNVYICDTTAAITRTGCLLAEDVIAGGSLTSFGQCTLSQLYTYKNSVTMKVDYDKFTSLSTETWGRQSLVGGPRGCRRRGHTQSVEAFGEVTYMYAWNQCPWTVLCSMHAMTINRRSVYLRQKT